MKIYFYFDYDFFQTFYNFAYFYVAKKSIFVYKILQMHLRLINKK